MQEARTCIRESRPSAIANGERNVDKCLGCNFYDRQIGKSSDAKGVQWGQCRRAAPRLHPINAKSFMIEGVWPHVRDDDWCGEWKAATRRVDLRMPEPASVPMVQGATPASPLAPRPSALSALQGGGSAFGLPPTPPTMSVVGSANTFSGRGD